MAVDEDRYLAERVDDQIEWHDRKSSLNQKCFKRLQLLSLACAALIPFISGILENPVALKWIVGGLGVIVAVIGGAISLYQFQQNWIDYRVTSEALRGEKYRFETRTPPYDGRNAFCNFVQSVEAILSEQNAKWQAGQQAAIEATEAEETAEDNS